MTIQLVPFDPELPGFDALLAKSRDEGHRMVLNLSENWRSGANRFTRPGELAVAAMDGDRVVGVAGLTIDPYQDDERVGRVRHVYVDPEYRRKGIGRMLMEPVMADPEAQFDVINLRAPPEAYDFYAVLGFDPVLGNDLVTHRLNLHLQRAEGE